MKNLTITIKPSGEWTWVHNNKSVKLWELYPCEDLSHYTKEIIDMMLKVSYGRY